MTPSRFKNSLATAFLSAAIAATPIAAMAQDAPPPPQYTIQYADQPDPADQSDQQLPPGGMQQDATAQYGAPQDVSQAPPAIPDYQQPEAPGDGYIWTPGYWAWTDDGYEWVDGAWVMPPYTGALWTPGYWGYGGYGYFWNAGYWGPYVGYYGGINYGFGYFGIGFYGGYWGGGHFWYNRAYCNVGFHNGYVYNRPYSGYSGHPGGSSYVHSTAIVANRGAGSAAFRGSTVNGRTSNFAQGASRPGYSAPAYSGARSYSGTPNYSGNYARSAGASNYGGYSGAARGYSGSTYSAPGRSFSAPSGSTYSAPARSYSAPAGGGFSGAGGGFSRGGGGFSGGGGGGGGFHGGGGHR